MNPLPNEYVPAFGLRIVKRTPVRYEVVRRVKQDGKWITERQVVAYTVCQAVPA